MINRAGFGSNVMTVVERMGGDLKRRLEGLAAAWKATDLADLNTIAIEWMRSHRRCRAIAIEHHPIQWWGTN
ncbi:hypothetical protein QUA70_24200 [Microcoleus sp. LAD1_D5]|uniref:hypothetical protein n=1 Tax=unclassified Microcoleus TaxID=2642155 RepID=UPI002FD3023F